MIELRWVQRPKSKTVSHLPDVAVTCYQRVLQFRTANGLISDNGWTRQGWTEWQDVPEVTE